MKKKTTNLIDHYITKKFRNRAFYGHGKKYKRTKFQPGTKYIVDVQENKIVILPHDGSAYENVRTVSKRKTKSDLIPVIDVKDKKSIQAFEQVDYLQIKVYEDHIVVEGYVKDDLATKTSAKAGKVADITNILKVKKIAQVIVPYEVLNKVAGGYEQLSIFDVSSEKVTTTETIDNVVGIDEYIEGISIPLRVVSLFSGAGLLDYGFKKAGFEIIFAIEKDIDAVATYKYNLGDHIVCADITQYDKTKIPKAEVIIGGPPCQGFSNANRKTNTLDNPNNLLMREYIEAVKANGNCKVFVIENVEEMLSKGGGIFLEEIKSELSDFEITHGVLTATDFGSAQKRKRAFVIGSKIGPISLPRPVKNAVKTVREAFKGLHDKIPNQLDYTIPKPETLERIKYIPQGGNWRDIPEHLRPKSMNNSGSTHSSIYRRLSWDEPSITIANPRKSNILHPTENRIISVREAARLFDLPDDFVFLSRINSRGKYNLSSLQQQVCNGVPVSLGYHIAKEIKNAIMRFNLSNRKSAFKIELNGQLALF